MDLETIQVDRADAQMLESRCWRLPRNHHDKDTWDVKSDHPVQLPTIREHCMGCGKKRKRSKFQLYCNSCGFRIRRTGTYEGPQDFLVWKLGRKTRVSDIVNHEET